MSTREVQSTPVLLPIQIMALVLTYDGELKSRQSTGVKEHKHAIRLHFADQLMCHLGSRQEIIDLKVFQDLIPYIRRRDVSFVPLVTSRLRLTCELDIMFQRPDPPGGIFERGGSGDIDNRLKVLFDALKVPKEDNELEGLERLHLGYPIGSPIVPCLLEDDSLIDGFRIRTAPLLGSKFKKGDVRIQIEAKITAQELTHDVEAYLRRLH